MELYVKNSTALIVEFWQKIIGRLTYLLSSEAIEETVSTMILTCLLCFLAIEQKYTCFSPYSAFCKPFRISVVVTPIFQSLFSSFAEIVSADCTCLQISPEYNSWKHKSRVDCRVLNLVLFLLMLRVLVFISRMCINNPHKS